jgi:hypothetical protein
MPFMEQDGSLIADASIPCPTMTDSSASEKKSPFDVPGIDCDITMDEILETLHESREGRL